MMQILEKKEVKEINALRTGSRTVPITDLHLEHSLSPTFIHFTWPIVLKPFFFLQFRDKVHRTLHTQFEC